MKRLLPLLALLAACPAPPEEPPADPTPQPAPEPINPWNEGPWGTLVGETLGHFILPLRGEEEFNFRRQWNGEESYVFVQKRTSTSQLWEGDFGKLIEESPDTVHYFFVSNRTDWAADVDAIRADLDAEIAQLDDDAAAHWTAHLHVVDSKLDDVGGVVESVLDSFASQSTGSWSPSGFAIDRFQRIRELGLMRFVTSDGSAPREPWFLASLPKYYDYEFNRETFLHETPADETLVLWDDFPKPWGSATAIVDLPSAETMATYDTLEIDLEMGCVDDVDANCFEWDYKAHLAICEAPLADDPPPGECQPRETDVDGNEITAADTAACPCTSPYGGDAERLRTCQAVTDDDGEVVGSQWSECACECGPEIARWITAYHREGRWLTDITPSLAMLQGGGPARFRFNTQYGYQLFGSLRFSNRGKESKPFAYLPLWGGGGYGAGYNDAHEPIEFEAPEGTTRVEVVAFITGHGFGSGRNCAEFCPHYHHFGLNGGVEQVQAYDEADDYLGCYKQIDDGTVPNQFGTWYLGRGGWCPGLDVPPYRADLTDDLTAGTNTITYRSTIDGNEPNNGGSIWMSSYLVFYK